VTFTLPGNGSGRLPVGGNQRGGLASLVNGFQSSIEMP
jgi:hypothetical protein